MHEHYFGGREHAAIKHFFLRQYLEVLAFKTLQSRKISNPSFAYIDGFTGPWGAKDDENYSDASFGVALDVLKGVKSRLPNAQIRCAFCESRKKAFRKLKDYVDANSGPIESKCFSGRFEDNIAEITNFIGLDGFVFAFLDPKGWKVDATSITPLLRGRWSEVLFNFMAEFIGRFPDYVKVKEAYAALLGDIDWRARFEATPSHLSNDDRVLLLFRDLLKSQWGFSHVLELPIKKLNRGRVFYKLVYGTRSPYGVLTFRDAQAKAEKEGTVVAVESKRSGQLGLFSSEDEAQQIVAAVGVGSRTHCSRLEGAILARLSAASRLTFLDLAADVLEEIPAREKDVKSTLENMITSRAVGFANTDGKSTLGRRSTLFVPR